MNMEIATILRFPGMAALLGKIFTYLSAAAQAIP